MFIQIPRGDNQNLQLKLHHKRCAANIDSLSRALEMAPRMDCCQSTVTPRRVAPDLAVTNLFPTCSNCAFVGYNYTYGNPVQSVSAQSWNVWVLCTNRGGCSDISAFAFIDKVVIRNCNYSSSSSRIWEENVKVNCSCYVIYNAIYVCVQAPFMFIVSMSANVTLLNCSVVK